MSKELKMMMVGLMVVALASIGGVVWALMSREALNTQIDSYAQRARGLETENAVLQEKIKLSEEEKGSLKEKIEAITQSLDVATAEREELYNELTELKTQKQDIELALNSLTQERDTLRERMQQMESTGFISRVIRERAELEVELASIKERFTENDLRVREAEEKSAALRQHLDELIQSKEMLEDELAKSEKVKRKLTDDYVAERDRRMILEQSSGNLKNHNEQYEKQISRLREELDGLRRNYEEASRARIALSKELAAMSLVLDERQVDISRMKSVVEKLTGAPTSSAAFSSPYSKPTMVTGTSAVELPPIVVTSDGAISSTTSYASASPVAMSTAPMVTSSYTGMQGRVLTVNKDHNFVVINIGENDGVTLGNFFDVMRDGHDIGEIEVIEVRKNISAADIVVLGADIASFKKDDMVIMK